MAEKKGLDSINELEKEYKSGRMPDRKRIALRQALLKIYNGGDCPKKEASLLIHILRNERSKNTIAHVDELVLNAYENGEATDKCIVKNDRLPANLFLSKDLECKYVYDADNDKYYVYVPVTVDTSAQKSLEVVRKEMMGHPVDPSEYKKPYIYYKRHCFDRRGFDFIFTVPDDGLLTSGRSEPEFKF